MWFRLRFLILTTIMSLFSLYVIYKLRFEVDMIVLSSLYSWTWNLDKLYKVLPRFNNFRRLLMEAQRVFNLHEIPQERVSEKMVPLLWPSKGQIEMKEIILRYRPNTNIILNGLSLKIEAG